MIGRPFPRLGVGSSKRLRARKDPPPILHRAQRRLFALPNDRIRLEQLAAPGIGTLPERLVRAVLLRSGLQWVGQNIEFGGRLHSGGAVVDFIVYIGAPPGVVIRVQGDYWHSLAPRRAKDRVQYDRLVAKGFRVVDLWEGDIYRAALGGYLDRFVLDAVYAGET